MARTTHETLCRNGFVLQRKIRKASDSHVISTKNAAHSVVGCPRQKRRGAARAIGRYHPGTCSLQSLLQCLADAMRQHWHLRGADPQGCRGQISLTNPPELSVPSFSSNGTHNMRSHLEKKHASLFCSRETQPTNSSPTIPRSVDDQRDPATTTCSTCFLFQPRDGL